MKILALSNLYPPDVIGGYEVICRQAVDGLRSRGHDVLVLTSAPRVPAPEAPGVRRALKLTDLYSYYGNCRITRAMHRALEAESRWFHAYNVHALIRAIEEFQPDVVYIHMLMGIGGLGLLACLRQMGVPWVWHLNDDVPLSLCRQGDDLVPGLVREVDRQLRGTFVAVSQLVVKEIEDGGIRLRPRLEILPNWVVGEPPPPREPFNPAGMLRIVTAGQVAHHKGIDILIEAARLLRERGHDRFVIDIYGHLNDMSFVRQVHMNDLGRHVRFRGYRPQAEVQRLYRDYDLFAFPTWAREPFGVAPLEAAWQGCVPVVSRVCGISEWLVEGVHCLKAQRTADAFAKVFAGVLDGTIDIAPIARRTVATIRRDFHIDAVIPRIERVLAEAARSPTGEPGPTDEVYRMAILAERLTQIMVQEPYLA
jgi:glycogen(starch) synthase